MLVDIIATNKDGIRNALHQQRIAMDKLEIALDEDLQSLQALLSDIRSIRNHHFSVPPSG